MDSTWMDSIYETDSGKLGFVSWFVSKHIDHATWFRIVNGILVA